jgi:ABC-type lipoprotein release transport system permease subunit
VLVVLLFGVPALDPVTYGGAAALLLTIALAACYAPVRRSVSIEPVAALRSE